MTPRQLDLAHEFCERVGSSDLFAYLGLPADTPAEQSSEALKARRRKMQGMQSNPKFQDEARLLIRNFSALEAVIEAPKAHLEDMARRRESSHLPILEMTIRGVLAGGNLSTEQEGYLRDNARELGVSEVSFNALLQRLLVERDDPASAGPNTSPTSSKSPPPPSRVQTLPPAPRNEATRQDKPAKPAKTESPRPDKGPTEVPRRVEPVRTADLPRTPERAGRTSEMPTAPPLPRSATPAGVVRGPPAGPRSSTDHMGSPNRGYSLPKGPPPGPNASTSTPPAMSRGTRPSLLGRTMGGTPAGSEPRGYRGPDHVVPGMLTEAATAPPVRVRTVAPGGAPTEVTTAPRAVARDILGDDAGLLEIVGPARHEVIVFGSRDVSLQLTVRLLGDLPVSARVSADDPWITVTPDRLDPAIREHTITVTIHPDRLFNDADETMIRVHNDLGDQKTTTIAVQRRFNWTPLLMGAGVVMALAAFTVLMFVIIPALLMPSNADVLQLNIDPSSDAVLINGDMIGSGPAVRYSNPPANRPLRITVVQGNFKTYEREVVLQPNETKILPIKLQLENKLDFVPLPDDIRTPLPPDAVRDSNTEDQLNQCKQLTPNGTPRYRGRVTVYFDPRGRPTGVHVKRNDPFPKVVDDCLRRKAAALSYPTLKDGTYAEASVEINYP